MLGGTSGTNFGMFMKGTRSDYDELANWIGSDEWSWDSLSPCFRRLERLDAEDRPKFPAGTHGIDGVIHTSSTRSQIPIENDFLDACREAAAFDFLTEDSTNGT